MRWHTDGPEGVGVFASLVSEIWVLVEGQDRAKRNISVQVDFKGGGRRYLYFGVKRGEFGEVSGMSWKTKPGIGLSGLRNKFPKGVPLMLPRVTFTTPNGKTFSNVRIPA